MKLVFLVDDDADDREIFNSAINSLQFDTQLIEAGNGQEALSTLIQPDFPIPDLMFVDLNMPKIGGLELLISIRKQDKYKDVPLFIYSTTKTEKERNQCLTEGATGFITKHNSFKALCTELKQLCQYYFGCSS